MREAAAAPAAFEPIDRSDASGNGDSPRVHCSRTGLTIDWADGRSSLLALAEAHGLKLPYACRSGMCGGCAQTLRSGEVRLIRKTTAPIAPPLILLCSTVPVTDVDIDI